MNVLIKSVGKTFLILVGLIILFNIGVFLSKHMILKNALDDVTAKASSKGYIDQMYFTDRIKKTKLPANKIIVISVTPKFNKYVEKLGDRFEITAKYNYEIKVMNNFSIIIPIVATSVDVNEGYYGKGY